MKNSTPKINRKVVEKIWNVLQEIEEKRQLSDPNFSFRIPLVPRGFRGSQADLDHITDDRKQIMERLVFLHAIKFLAVPDSSMRGVWVIKPLEGYNRVFEEYENEYSELARDYQQLEERKIANTDVEYRASYSEKSREILVNGLQIAKPDFDSENERFFTYVYANPNRKINLDELKANGVVLKKTIHKVVENLGFTGQLKIFFDASKTSVRFINPITRELLDAMKIKFIEIK